MLRRIDAHAVHEFVHQYHAPSAVVAWNTGTFNIATGESFTFQLPSNGAILNKVGCTAGTCHGAAKGKNGFKLSLRGYDPILDHRALTDDLAGRRFDRAAPDRSLMLPGAVGVWSQSDSVIYFDSLLIGPPVQAAR